LEEAFYRMVVQLSNEVLTPEKVACIEGDPGSFEPVQVALEKVVIYKTGQNPTGGKNPDMARTGH
jgi:hypothetical protein